MSKLSQKIVQIVHKCKIVNNKNVFQNSQNFKKNVKIVKKIWKKLLKLSNCQKLSTFFKNCQNVDQVMFPHNFDQISQKLQVSWAALCLSKVKVPGSWQLSGRMKVGRSFSVKSCLLITLIKCQIDKS